MPRATSKTQERNVAANGLGGYFGSGKGSSGPSSWAGRARWEDIDASTIIACLVSADAAGVALLFGSNRDKSALALGVFKDGQKNTFYFNAGDAYTEGVESWLWEFAQHCQAAVESEQSAARKASNG